MSNYPTKGWWTHQWGSRHAALTVYYDGDIWAEYEGRFKQLRAFIYIWRHRLLKGMR